MFKPEKDERLCKIELEAGTTAFLTYFFIAMALMIVRGFSDAGILSDPDFLLVLPWLLVALVYISVLRKKGYYATIREESQRTKKQVTIARSSLILYVFILMVIHFVFERLNILSLEDESISQDLLDSAGFALFMGFAMWFMTVRRYRGKNERA
jgi:amino acid permease